MSAATTSRTAPSAAAVVSTPATATVPANGPTPGLDAAALPVDAAAAPVEPPPPPDLLKDVPPEPRRARSERSAVVQAVWDRIAKQPDFPCLPSERRCVLGIAGEDDSRLQGLAEAILRDIGTSSRVLRLVNSAFYRPAGAGQITSIGRAIQVLGYTTVIEMSRAQRSLADLPPPHGRQVRMEMLRALLAGALARELQPEVRLEQEAFLAGVFQHLGALLLALHQPEAATRWRAAASAVWLRMPDDDALAQQQLGQSMNELGVDVARQWGWAPALRHAMAWLPGGPGCASGRVEELRLVASLGTDLAPLLLGQPPEAWPAACVQLIALRPEQTLFDAERLFDVLTRVRLQLPELISRLDLQVGDAWSQGGGAASALPPDPDAAPAEPQAGPPPAGAAAESMAAALQAAKAAQAAKAKAAAEAFQSRWQGRIEVAGDEPGCDGTEAGLSGAEAGGPASGVEDDAGDDAGSAEARDAAAASSSGAADRTAALEPAAEQAPAAGADAASSAPDHDPSASEPAPDTSPQTPDESATPDRAHTWLLIPRLREQAQRPGRAGSAAADEAGRTDAAPRRAGTAGADKTAASSFQAGLPGAGARSAASASSAERTDRTANSRAGSDPARAHGVAEQHAWASGLPHLKGTAPGAKERRAESHRSPDTDSGSDAAPRTRSAWADSAEQAEDAVLVPRAAPSDAAQHGVVPGATATADNGTAGQPGAGEAAAGVGPDTAAASGVTPAAAKPGAAVSEGLDRLTLGIQDTSQALLAGEPVPQFLRRVLDILWRSLGARQAVLCLREPALARLRPAFVLGVAEALGPQCFHVELRDSARELFAQSCRLGTDTLINDIAHPEVRAQLPEWHRRRLAQGAFLLLPMRVKDRPVGMIYLDHAEPGRLQPQEAEMRLVRALRNQALLALQKGMGAGS